jgi:hypothetical protein
MESDQTKRRGFDVPIGEVQEYRSSNLRKRRNCIADMPRGLLQSGEWLDRKVPWVSTKGVSWFLTARVAGMKGVV